jgi:cytochrome oxidase assembly protein ShyY1
MIHCKTEVSYQPNLARTQQGRALIPILLLVLTLIAGAAAVWQWQRSEYHTHKANAATAQLLQPQNLNKDNTLSSSYVTVTGTWLADSTTFVSPRLLNGQLGAQVLSVLAYIDAKGKTQHIAVQRGWAVQPAPTVAPAVAGLTSLAVKLDGELVANLPKAFELKALVPDRLGLWQNYEPLAHSQLVKVALQPKILVLLPTSPDAEREQLRRIPAQQAIDTLVQKSVTNRGYALQWLGLSLVGLMGLAWMWISHIRANYKTSI